MAPQEETSTNVGEAAAAAAARPTRFCFRVRVDDIPGVPLARSITLADNFMLERFSRRFTWDTDYVYTPSTIGGVGKAWILLDVDKDAFPKLPYDQVILDVLRVTIRGGKFTYTPVHYRDIRHFTSMFPFGGRPPAPKRSFGP